MKVSWRTLALGSLFMLTSCASVQPPQPPSLQLPTPPADLRATRKGNKVTLTWTVPTQTTDRQVIRNFGQTLICRGLEPVLKECGSPVGQVGIDSSGKSVPKTQATYVDTIPEQLEREHPLDFATYALEALNPNGRAAGLSKQLHVPLAPTLPPPSEVAAQVTAQGVVLACKETPAPPNPDLHYVYRFLRRAQNNQQPALIGELPLSGQEHFIFTDSNIEWEQTYYYRVSVVTVAAPHGQAEVRVEGDDTPEIKVFAHDVFPPAVPGGIQGVFSGPGQPPFIDLIWAPVPDLDLAGYNLYRREEGTNPVKINPELITSPAYRDSNVSSGKTYLYSVSAVDVRGNESARSEEAGESVPKEP